MVPEHHSMSRYLDSYTLKLDPEQQHYIMYSSVLITCLNPVLDRVLLTVLLTAIGSSDLTIGMLSLYWRVFFSGLSWFRSCLPRYF